MPTFLRCKLHDHWPIFNTERFDPEPAAYLIPHSRKQKVPCRCMSCPAPERNVHSVGCLVLHTLGDQNFYSVIKVACYSARVSQFYAASLHVRETNSSRGRVYNAIRNQSKLFFLYILLIFLLHGRAMV